MGFGGKSSGGAGSVTIDGKTGATITLSLAEIEAASPLAGDLDVNGHKLIGLAAATANGNAVRYDEFVARKLNDLVAASADYAMGSHSLTGLRAPTTNGEAARYDELSKLYPSHDLQGAMHVDALKPTAAIRESLRRVDCSSVSLSAMNTGVMMATAVYYAAGDVVTNISFVAGSTALANGTGGTHAWVALYDGSGNLLGYSADDTAATIAANAEYKKQLTKNAAAGAITSFTITTSGLYYHCICIASGTGGTQPTWSGTLVSQTTLALTPILSGTTGSSLTTTPPSSFTPSALSVLNNRFAYTYSS